MNHPTRKPLELGAFSVSLAVKDVNRSLAFYEKLGFSRVGGDPEQNWVIIRSCTTTIGLFQGMFERNMLTFNPGWDASGNAVESFADVRVLQAQFERQGIQLQTRVDETTSGPGSVIMVDPDGNPIMFDQHI
jgi:catechol 2,3-dioxygenase-like lactoylglutathione lyase family enzyme